MNKTLLCRDCNIPFTRGEFDTDTKCLNCLERDQAWIEKYRITEVFRGCIEGTCEEI